MVIRKGQIHHRPNHHLVADRHGIRLSDVGLDLAKMMERKNRVVKGLTEGVAFLLKKNKITWVQ